MAADYNRHRMLTIGDLPDDDLLEIFNFYVVRYQDVDCHQSSEFSIKRRIESWQSLVHVCRRWRGLVFASPRRLKLRLYCTTRTPARETLDVWPALPLHVHGDVYGMSVEKFIAVLKHSNRIRRINLDCIATSYVEELWTAMQVPFPNLQVLRVTVRPLIYVPNLPDSFMGGSAPRLRSIYLTSIPLPGLSKLLLSATRLVQLHLHRIPHSGYISPEAMVTCLSTLASLESLHIQFQSLQSSPDQEIRRPPPPTRPVLPALTKFRFNGVKEYLEDFVSRIDAPRLYRLSTTLFNVIDFVSPELNQFISRTPAFGAYNEALLFFRTYGCLVRLQSRPEPSDHGMVEVKITYDMLDRQFLSLAQICTSCLRLLLTMENLYIVGDPHLSLEPIENAGWLAFLLPFTAVKNLYLCEIISPSIARALQELTGGRTIEVFPALKNVLLEGFHPSEPVQEGIVQFISARQLANHPVAISDWDRDLWDQSLEWG